MDPSGNPGQMPQAPPPPPDWGQPSQPVGAWASPTPTPNRSRFPIAIGGVLVILLVVGGLFAFNYLQVHKDDGKVVFTTDKPVAAQTTNCSPANQVTSVKAGTSVYAWYVFASRQGSDPVALTITKDGAEFMPANTAVLGDVSGLDCAYDASDLGSLFKAGTYKLTVTSGGKTISEGTLTITP